MTPIDMLATLIPIRMPLRPKILDPMNANGIANTSNRRTTMKAARSLSAIRLLKDARRRIG